MPCGVADQINIAIGDALPGTEAGNKNRNTRGLELQRPQVFLKQEVEKPGFGRRRILGDETNGDALRSLRDRPKN